MLCVIDLYLLLANRSHPDSLNYGKYWSLEQVNKVFSPSIDTVTIVRSWLAKFGITAVQSKNNGSLIFSASARQVEIILHTEYYNYQDMSSGNKGVACEQYHVPSTIHDHIDYVMPGVMLKAPTKQKNRVSKGNMANYKNTKYIEKRKQPDITNKTSLLRSSLRQGVGIRSLENMNCIQSMTPQCIKILYNIPEVTNVQPNNPLGIYESSSNYSQTVLDAFFHTFAPEIPTGTTPIYNEIGNPPASQITNIVEANLDLQVTLPIIYPQNVSFLLTNDPDEQTFLDPFLEAIDWVCSSRGSDISLPRNIKWNLLTLTRTLCADISWGCQYRA